jgi:hypothetical protein
MYLHDIDINSKNYEIIYLNLYFIINHRTKKRWDRKASIQTEKVMKGVIFIFMI